MAPKLALRAAFVLVWVIGACAQENEWKSLIDRGAAAEAAGDYAAAAGFYREGARLDGSREGRVYALNALGAMQDALGKFVDAETSFRTALRLCGDDARSAGNRAMILVNLAAVSTESGQPARAEKLFREALQLQTEAPVSDPIRLAVTRNALGELMIMAGRVAEAESLVIAAVTTLEKFPSAWSETAIARNNLAVVRTDQGRLMEAQSLIDGAIGALESGAGANHPVLVRVLNNLAVIQHRRGEVSRAGQTWRRALDVAARTLGTEHPTYAGVLAQYARHLRDSGDKRAAKSLAAQAEEILRGIRRRNGIGAVVDVSAFGRQE